MGQGASKPKPKRVAVLGGGPAGLTAAYRLLQSKTAFRVDVYESSATFGGAITTEERAGFLYDLGPNSMNAKHPAVANLLFNDLHLTSRMQHRQAARRFLIVRDGKLTVVPMSPRQFLASSLLTTRAKLRLLIEPLIPRVSTQRAADRESVADFCERRFGREVVDYVVDPVMAGMYSASPTQLSMKHAFRKVWAVERAKGSVIGGVFRGAMKTKKDPRFPDYTRKELMASFNYDGGMAVLADTLVSEIRTAGRMARLYKKTKVRSLDRDARGRWNVNGRGRYDAVISTIPTYGLSAISSNVRTVQRGFRRLASNIAYAPMSVVVLGFDKKQVPDDIHGFGTLFPSREGSSILGVNFSSEGFPSRLKDKSKVFWTVYVGGNRKKEAVFQPAGEVVESSTKELQKVFGIDGKPFFARVKSWTRGIPVYGPGYDKALCAMARIEKGAAGLVLGGNYRGGVGVPDALLSGIESAEKVEKLVWAVGAGKT